MWPKLTFSEINTRVANALNKNVNYRKTPILGLPGTYLDSEVFYEDAPFLQNAPFLSTLIANPNHIGCHTLQGDHERMFLGTQELEREVIQICNEDIFLGEPNQQDGYIASGGTEANIQALWIYRNYFISEHQADISQIGVVFSEDSHYSMPKGVNLLNLQSIVIKTDPENRSLNITDLEAQLDTAINKGINYFIIVMNMGTTMFGSIDDIDAVTSLLNSNKLEFKLHVDAAFGGFIYPFTNTESKYNFKNKHITSITIDGHKMLQTPYGTGIFLIRKGFMNYVCTSEAQYVLGKDYTLCGSRSGANAVAVWMVLHNHGYDGWKLKMQMLLDRTSELSFRLKEAGVAHYRNPFMNIITIPASYISKAIAEKYFLVPDNHETENKWWKIVVMPHITRGIMDVFINDVKAEIVKQ